MKRTYKLTDEEYRQLDRHARATRAFGDILGEALARAAELSAQSDQQFWKDVREMVGANEHQTVTISWLRRVVEIDEKEVKDGS